MRTLVVNIGNTSLFGGVFDGAMRNSSFRLPAGDLVRLPRRVRDKPARAVVCSVVPALTSDVLHLIRRTWHLDAVVFTAREEHGLKIAYRDPRALGADRLAAALGARVLFPSQNAIVVDCGTATTVTALTRTGTLAGGAILPGVSLWSEMLARRTAQLPRVTLKRPRSPVGRSPVEGIASGVFYGHLGAIRETVARIQRAAFGHATAVVIGTGGHAPLFAAEAVFTSIEPDLVLIGLNDFAKRATFPPDPAGAP